jgi:hypothetical protein
MGLTLTGSILECVCLCLEGVRVTGRVGNGAWVVVRSAGIGEESDDLLRMVDLSIELDDTYSDVLQHVKSRPEGSCVAIGRVCSCAPHGTTGVPHRTTAE